MGSLTRHEFECPSCANNEVSAKELFTHFFNSHMLKCETCQLTGFKNQHNLDQHREEFHSNSESKLTCPLCGKTCQNEEEFTGHVIIRHKVSYKQEADTLLVLCPPCNKYLQCDKTIVTHLAEHMDSETIETTYAAQQQQEVLNRSTLFDSPPSYSEVFGDLPSQPTAPAYDESMVNRSASHLPPPIRFKVGDRVNAMWASTKYQYFPATIVEVHEQAKKCIVRWDDGDTTGLIIDFHNMAHDRIPSDNELQIGSLVLFSQGAYRAGETQLTGGQRWHQGIITRIYQGDDGTRLYSGFHLKDQRDGKSIHSGYSREFVGYLRTDLREGIMEDCTSNSTTSHPLPRPTVALHPPPPTAQQIPPLPAACIPPKQVNRTSPQNQQYLENRNLPKCGDRVLAMWVRSKWQYFHATIRQVMPNLQYLIEWDDGDVTGLIVNCFDVAVDTIPDPNDIGVESIVLFQQGRYSAGAHQQTGGVRWHQGKITRVYQANDGATLYDGCHTKSESDGKWVTYKGYAKHFTGLKLEELRNGPNIFDVIDTSSSSNEGVNSVGCASVGNQEEERSMQESIERKSMNYLLNIESKLKEKPPNPVQNSVEYEVFVSYCWDDSYTAKKAGHIPKCCGTRYSDPRLVHNVLSESFLTWLDIDRLHVSSRNDTLFQQHSDAIKKSSVFLVFVSDDYAANVFCQMQFQYACKTLNKHVVPVIVGKSGKDEWKKTIVGMLLKSNDDRFKVHDFRDIHREAKFQNKMKDVIGSIKEALKD